LSKPFGLLGAPPFNLLLPGSWLKCAISAFLNVTGGTSGIQSSWLTHIPTIYVKTACHTVKWCGPCPPPSPHISNSRGVFLRDARSRCTIPGAQPTPDVPYQVYITRSKHQESHQEETVQHSAQMSGHKMEDPELGLAEGQAGSLFSPSIGFLSSALFLWLWYLLSFASAPCSTAVTPGYLFSARSGALVAGSSRLISFQFSPSISCFLCHDFQCMLSAGVLYFSVAKLPTVSPHLRLKGLFLWISSLSCQFSVRPSLCFSLMLTSEATLSLFLVLSLYHAFFPLGLLHHIFLRFPRSPFVPLLALSCL
jgi:hypothetical protein